MSEELNPLLSNRAYSSLWEAARVAQQPDSSSAINLSILSTAYPNSSAG